MAAKARLAWLVAAAAAAGCAGATVERAVPEGRTLASLRRHAGRIRTKLSAAERRLRALSNDLVGPERTALGLADELRAAGIRITPGGASIIVMLAERVLFAPGKVGLGEAARSKLADVAKVLNERFPGRPVSVEGHSDSSPTEKTAKVFPTNWELSAARAVAVLRCLVEEGGLDPERVSVRAFADTRPAEKGDAPERRAANRRVEIVVLPALEIRKVSASFE